MIILNMSDSVHAMISREWSNNADLAGIDGKALTTLLPGWRLALKCAKLRFIALSACAAGISRPSPPSLIVQLAAESCASNGMPKQK